MKITKIVCSLGQKVLNSQYCNGIFSVLEHNHQTRGIGVNFQLPASRIELIKKSFLYFVPKLWNELPANIKTLRNIDTFKKHVKTHYFIEQTQAQQ